MGGVGLAVAGTRALESRIVEVEASPWDTFALAALAFGLTALLAAYAPARRATRVDPVQTMRTE
jgi:ABC-type lipoprotein release transport system permease subunit